jgi:hypothetical protein
MIDRTSLLEDLKRLVTRVEGDLLARSDDADVPEIAAVLRGEYERARAAKRTADTYGEWREDRITQVAVAWVLSCVFVRFLEDNDLISPPWVAGPGERLRQARDAHQHYFLSHPRDTDRDYLLSLFDELAASPGTSGIFGPHNALREIPNWLSGDKAREVIQFFQKIDANTSLLVHDFTDPAWDTRFLGDLYQDLSAYARSRYALLQTPHFIEQFLLDRTLEPALDEFGLIDSFKMIDPACGSGHLVLGSFERILHRWQRSEPATPVREVVRRALSSVHGVDINPFAVAIARFRLLLVAMRACEIKRLTDAPDFQLNIECGDSLLHVPLIGGQTQLFATHEGGMKQERASKPKKKSDTDDECEHAYASENLRALKANLRHGQYHAVMANPPYIVVRDLELSQRYRRRFSTCHRQYSLAVPFMEHIYALCVRGGFTGQITANSFMKREFGKPLITTFFPTVDLTHVIDTSGAYVPGHGTPTVILFGRRRPPVAGTVRAVMGIRGEPATPADPANGFVWTAIRAQVDKPGSQSEYVSVGDAARAIFHKHPWSVGGGGASDLKQQLEDRGHSTLADAMADTGRTTHTGEDDVFYYPAGALKTTRLSRDCVPLVTGEVIRDYLISPDMESLFPYDRASGEPRPIDNAQLMQRFQTYRTTLRHRRDFGQSIEERGLRWVDHSMFFPARYRAPLSIAFAFVATHNHFVLDRGGKVFNRSAPVIKLPPTASEDDHFALLGILNSSTACFWMKQVCHQKQMMGGDGIRITDKSKVPYEFHGTALAKMPFPEAWRTTELRARLIEVTRRMDELASEHASLSADALLESGDWAGQLRRLWGQRTERRTEIRSQQVYLQEQMDFLVYRMFGLIEDDGVLGEPVPPAGVDMSPGARPYCLICGQNSDGFPVPSGVPSQWPLGVQQLWKNRIAAIKGSASLQLVETSMYKRRWIGRQGLFNHARSADELKDAVETYLLARLEQLVDFDGRMNDAGKPTAALPVGLISVGVLADAASHDALFMEAAEVFVGAAGFDVTTLVGQLVEKASVPFLPVLRYKATGIRKHEEWKEVWELQRKEDAIDARTVLPSDDRNHLSTEQAADLKRREVGDSSVSRL